jgi:hypothetical protein
MASRVTSQSGHGSGPRHSRSTLLQLDQRWFSFRFSLCSVKPSSSHSKDEDVFDKGVSPEEEAPCQE